MPFFDQMRTFENADRYVATKMTAADLVAMMVFDGARRPTEAELHRRPSGATATRSRR